VYNIRIYFGSVNNSNGGMTCHVLYSNHIEQKTSVFVCV